MKDPIPDSAADAVGITTTTVLLERLEAVAPIDGDMQLRARVLASLLAASAQLADNPHRYIQVISLEAQRRLRRVQEGQL